MYPQDPKQQPVPSVGQALLELVKPGWKWFRELRPVVQVLAAALVVVLLYSCGAGSRSGSGEGATERAGGASPQPSASSSALPAGLTAGAPPEESVDLDTELATQDYADWLTKFGALEVDEDSIPDIGHDLDALADDYGGDNDQDGLVTTIPGAGSRVRSGLKIVAKQIASGEKALKNNEYDRAGDSFDRAMDQLSKLRSVIKDDLLAIERGHGLRMTRSGAVDPAVTSEYAIVESWVDGDTVDTDLGRVRVLGINTPEMHEQCQPAKAAKEAASQLAPRAERVKLVNPESVQDTDKYGRLLRYVDVASSSATSSATKVDVGYSLLLSNLAEPRYDSQDGYQWHPREAAYHATAAKPAPGVECPDADETSAFVLASTLAATKGDDEYWRRKIMNETIAGPYRSASKNLKKLVTSVREEDEKAEREEEAAEERDQRDRSQELARERQNSGGSSNNDSADTGSSSGSGGYPGYNGPRCYAPGGKTWKPC